MKNAVKLQLLIIFLFMLKARSKSVALRDMSDMEGAYSDTKSEKDAEEAAEPRETFINKHKYNSDDIHKEVKRHSYRDVDSEWRPQCAVMYRNSEPAGILQPYGEAFKFLPVNGEATIVDLDPVSIKRKSIVDVLYPSKFENEYEDLLDGKVGFADDSNGLVDGVAYSDNEVSFSNDKTSFTDNKEGFTYDKTSEIDFPIALAKFKINNRMDSSRLFRRNKAKREKGNFAAKEGQLKSLKGTIAKRKTDESEAVEEELRGILNDMGLIDDPTDEKRAAEEDENMETGNDAVNMIKDEPASTGSDKKSKRGDFGLLTTVAPINGNTTKMMEFKYSFDSTEKSEEKRDANGKTKKSVRREAGDTALTSDEVDVYEKRVEREIRDKIQQLKEEVKKEIEALKSAKSSKIEFKRKKRAALNSLLDGETVDIDPVMNYEGTKKQLIRRKRAVVSEKNLDIGIKTKGTHIGRNLKEVDYDYNDPERLDHARSKRDSRDYEQSEYYDYDEFADNNTPMDKQEASSYVHHKHNCQCDKSGTCKCRKFTGAASNDFSDFMVDPERVIRAAVSESKHCHCDKNDSHCKCKLSEKRKRAVGEEALDFRRLKKRMGKESERETGYRLIKREAKLGTNRNKFKCGEYYVDLHPEAYRLTPKEASRNKREMLLSRSNNPTEDLTSRVEPPHPRIRRTVPEDNDQRQLIDMSEEEIFGALPQSFEGELQRYKRVKRTLGDMISNSDR